MKHCVLQDSSFLIATIDINDDFHKDALLVFQELMKNRRDLKIIIPTLVFFETIITLMKKGVSQSILERKLWGFLFHDTVLNVSLIETKAFKVCKRLRNKPLTRLGTNDLIIIDVGLEYEAQILTFDKNMRERVGEVYPEIYYCSSNGNQIDETPNFLSDFYKKIGKGIIDIDEIPF
ncbi:MAG: PIN domain-containing protein [Candidatus Berkelbacteria bacterium]|nr:PIN domain-containing protein [Candidatus Berkelbacteria bacterium]